MTISLFASAQERKPVSNITIKELCKRIKNGEWEDRIDLLKNKDPKKQKIIKATKIPAVTLCGTFKERKGIPIKHSGFIGIDIDGQDNDEDLLDKRTDLESDPYVCGCWLSVRGNGLRLLFRIETNKHLEAFLGIQDYLHKK